MFVVFIKLFFIIIEEEYKSPLTIYVLIVSIIINNVLTFLLYLILL